MVTRRLGRVEEGMGTKGRCYRSLLLSRLNCVPVTRRTKRDATMQFFEGYPDRRLPNSLARCRSAASNHPVAGHLGRPQLAQEGFCLTYAFRLRGLSVPVPVPSITRANSNVMDIPYAVPRLPLPSDPLFAPRCLVGLHRDNKRVKAGQLAFLGGRVSDKIRTASGLLSKGSSTAVPVLRPPRTSRYLRMTAPGSVSAERLLEIREDVTAIVNERVFPVFVETILYTLYSVLMITHLIKHRNNPRHAPSIFALSMWLYLPCTVCWALDFSLLWTDLYRYLPGTLSPAATSSSDNDRLALNNSNRIFVRAICGGTVFVFCDVVAMWRAYVLYGRPRWLGIGCLCLFAFSSVMYTMVGVFDATTLLRDPPSFASHRFTPTAALELTAFSTTLLAHLGSTILISRKAWIHRRWLRKLIDTQNGSGGSNDSKPMVVVYTVIESGIMYTSESLWAVYVSTGWLSDYGRTWTGFWMYQISGMYPTLVVVVVLLRGSLLEQSAARTGDRRVGTLVRRVVDGTRHDVDLRDAPAFRVGDAKARALELA
ncbi:unnamed protein product [Peniophora sp. CBMAI 1063]|nr:unnamed protein product [Peniophora sp. CBMAI 1063]